MEIRFFRLMLLSSVISFVLLLSGSFYKGYVALQWEKVNLLAMHDMATYSKDCSVQTANSNSSCELFKFAHESANTALEEQGKNKTKAGYFLRWSILLPIIFVFLFYAGRWILLGTIKPALPYGLRPLIKNPQ